MKILKVGNLGINVRMIEHFRVWTDRHDGRDTKNVIIYTINGETHSFSGNDLVGTILDMLEKL